MAIKGETEYANATLDPYKYPYLIMDHSVQCDPSHIHSRMHHKSFTHSHTHTHTLASRILTSGTLSHINKLPHIISCYYNTNSSKLKKNDSLTY